MKYFLIWWKILIIIEKYNCKIVFHCGFFFFKRWFSRYIWFNSSSLKNICPKLDEGLHQSGPVGWTCTLIGWSKCFELIKERGITYLSLRFDDVFEMFGMIIALQDVSIDDLSIIVDSSRSIEHRVRLEQTHEELSSYVGRPRLEIPGAALRTSDNYTFNVKSCN